MMKKLKMATTSVLNKWLIDKDIKKGQGNTRRQLLENKRKKIHMQEAKSKKELLLERNRNPKCGTYGTGIGVIS